VPAGSATTVIFVNALVRFLLRVVVLALIFWAVTKIVTGIEVTPGQFGQVGTLLWIALIFAVVNTIIGPIVRLLSLPFVVLTLGLFLLVINAAMVGITAALSDRLDVDGFVGAVVSGFLIALFSWAAELVLPLKVRR
jgi:putative membrane protein